MAIAADHPEDSRVIAETYGLEFPLLCDPEAETIRAYGAVHADGNPMDGEDIARPATFILDRQGRVVWHYLPDNWRIRPRPEELIAELAKIP